GRPEHRIQAAVRNAREALENELGWARSIGDRESVMAALNLRNRLDADPRACVQALSRLLGMNQEPEPEPVDLSDPEPDLWSEDRTQQAYSANLVRQMLYNLEQRLMQQLRPTMDFAEETRAQQQEREQQERW